MKTLASAAKCCQAFLAGHVPARVNHRIERPVGEIRLNPCDAGSLAGSKMPRPINVRHADFPNVDLQLWPRQLTCSCAFKETSDEPLACHDTTAPSLGFSLVCIRKKVSRWPSSSC